MDPSKEEHKDATLESAIPVIKVTTSDIQVDVVPVDLHVPVVVTTPENPEVAPEIPAVDPGIKVIDPDVQAVDPGIKVIDLDAQAVDPGIHVIPDVKVVDPRNLVLDLKISEVDRKDPVVDSEQPGPSTRRVAYEPSILTLVQAILPPPPSDESSGNSPEEFNNKDNKGQTLLSSRSPVIQDGSIFDGFSRRQLWCLAVLAVSDFMGAILLTNQNPWYPIQAREHSLSIGLAGTVFATYELGCLLALPLFLSKLHQCCVSPQTMFHLGAFTTSTAVILLSFLGYVSDWRYFFGISLFLRLIEGIGQAAFITASVAIIALEFPNSLSTAFVSLETFFGLGLVIGPPLGGALWDALSAPERFTLTFGMFGGFGCLVSIGGLFLLPQASGDHVLELERRGYARGFRIFGLLNVPFVPAICFAILSTAYSIGFLFVTLSPLLAEFELTPVLYAGIFTLNGSTAALMAPFFTRLVDFTHRSKLLIIFGSLLVLIGFLLLGPMTFIPLQRSPWLISIGLSLQGIGVGALLAVTSKYLLYRAIQCGYADNIKTYWLVSSLWTMTFCLGTLLGTLTSGFLFDEVGFNKGCWVVLDLHLLVILFTVTSIISNRIMKIQTTPRHDGLISLDTESEPLLGPRRSYGSKFTTIHEESQRVRKRIHSDPTILDRSRESINEDE